MPSGASSAKSARAPTRRVPRSASTPSRRAGRSVAAATASEKLWTARAGLHSALETHTKHASLEARLEAQKMRYRTSDCDEAGKKFISIEVLPHFL